MAGATLASAMRPFDKNINTLVRGMRFQFSMRTLWLAAPKRRWFRWSLRTLFVVATLLAGVVGWQAWRWHRRFERLTLLSTPGVSYQSDSWGDDLGLEDVREIDVGPNVPDDVYKRMQQVFPDAMVRRGTGMRLPYHLSTFTHP
jgi:hypothetical protein